MHPLSKIDLTILSVDRCTENDGSWVAQMVAAKGKRKGYFLESHKGKTEVKSTIKESKKFVVQSLDSNNYAEDLLRYTEKQVTGCFFCRKLIIEHMLVTNKVSSTLKIGHVSTWDNPQAT